MAILRLPGAADGRKRIPFAPFRTLGVLLVQFVVLAFLLLGILLVHTNQDLRTLDAYTAYMADLSRTSQETLRTWQQHGAVAALQVLRKDLQEIAATHPQQIRDNPHWAKLQLLVNRQDAGLLPEALLQLSDISMQEHARGRRLVLAAGHDARYTLIGTAVALFSFMIFVLVTLVFFRLRILGPLRRLQDAMHSLEIGAFRRVSEAHADPGISPLLQYYNHMIGRLEDLEKTRRQYLQDLQREVNEAAHTLVAQQAAVARSERLAAVGEAAAAFAHELRNPLAGLQVGCANIRREIRDPELAERLGLMEEELRRVSRLLDQQLRGARQAHEKGRRVAPRETVETLLNLLRYQMPAQVKLELLPGECRDCLLPLDQFRQALLNLILNSMQALAGEGGQISVALAQVDKQLQVVVADNGPGFPDTLLREGIRPFASSKEQGTGLGLSMVRRFVRSLGGEVQLRNREPHGAEVCLLLPCPEIAGKE
ncbi:HAMP domain-containing sensor histidine kinase [Acidithiobacillus montserratensis]|uniref:HAMP domain-containing sensor histidine kinase n=1 Tax=Acidithiobacillus montserratensis TaxID=2729135 RepID=A0ACD5HEB1_9PROT|nr:HAMP domain-containing sensor histidine kinase [Acidithiobacillus montserratensis]MBN2679636.1 HAMP domain-containing histidine kinase [Acidithiobacillaceae bacterium]MBU2747467.1 HAMP domain-containing histidine kinase [Acidithiobacillus montserratensis]